MTGGAKPDGVVVLGAGGFGREVAQYAEETWGAGVVRGFLDDRYSTGADLGAEAPVLGGTDLIECGADYLVAIGNARARARLAAVVAARGGRLVTLCHPAAHVAPTARLGAGCVLCPFAFVGAGAWVGENVVLNTYASVAHDAVVGRDCVFSPYATVNGEVVLGAAVFLGTRATVTPRHEVGAGAALSAGAVAFHDIAAGTVVAGNPAAVRRD
ncbi:transferase [Pilimelia anulata]|uniref:Transferase n=1 Tax=Pilimelia anulata TaxID=53371 RepID=A0A8J3BB13_9ACTN|nr:NeuD/PglB/VioB family sugar acetyltransferase [Pilimelia anulata]GGJ91563.1 transferase [Pilimelia anulata]